MVYEESIEQRGKGVGWRRHLAGGQLAAGATMVCPGEGEGKQPGSLTGVGENPAPSGHCHVGLGALHSPLHVLGGLEK